MHKQIAILALIATVAIFGHASADGIRDSGKVIVLAGGMGGGGAGGGMGMAGGGMGGMGGMTGGGMGGMSGGGTGGMFGGGMSGYEAMPGAGAGRPYSGSAADPGVGGAQPAQYYLCMTRYGQCPVAASPGSLQRGVSCTCSNGHQGKIK